MNAKEAIEAISRIPGISESGKGAKFERLMQQWLLQAPAYRGTLDGVWLWKNFPGRQSMGGNDLGIDLVARTVTDEYWAVQCKCYAEDTSITKADVDTFLSHSGKSFLIDGEPHAFSLRLLISTTDRWSRNAEQAIRHQKPPVIRISRAQIDASGVDLESLLENRPSLFRRKEPQEHQRAAIAAAHGHFAGNDRGQLVMACGTGKTFTSLKIMEQETGGKGLVLYLVPSIALLGQAHNAWMADSACITHAICVCSDPGVNSSTKKNDDADPDADLVDLALPASTSPEIVLRQLEAYNDGGLTVMFSTYQSIDVIHAAQNMILEETDGSFGVFDLVVCDEAHRTTGVKSKKGQKDNLFARIHDNAFIQARKRLYMTATPRMYGKSARTLAKEKEAMLWSMDDEAVFGREFYRVNFSYAVEHGLLTDYKVMILTVPKSKNELPDAIRSMIDDPDHPDINLDFVTKLSGCISALSKHLPDSEAGAMAMDPGFMHRALAFCQTIGTEKSPGTSKNVAAVLPKLAAAYIDALPEDRKDTLVPISARHVDGTMGAVERNRALQWLAESGDRDECRVLCNVRCLSEGIDVPALDAVIFLSPKRSEIDIVQAIGRVMRTFRKGEPGEKKFGYIIVPVAVFPGTDEAEVLENSEFNDVWSILRALRAHDDRFNVMINQIRLNRRKPERIVVANLEAGWWKDAPGRTAVRALPLPGLLVSLQEKIFGHVVEKVGDRLYWDRWAESVGEMARTVLARIHELVPEIRTEFDTYLDSLRENLNAGVDENQAVDMLAQFFITRPVFRALFARYDFDDNNPVSRSLHAMIDLLERHGFGKDTAKLDEFYDSVRRNVGTIDNMAGRQTIIKNLYERFFAGAFRETVKALGIVYTPVECVDFILHSVEAILQQEFGQSLSDENVHILDPFTGTGTFITRLLQSGIIRKEDMLRKYTQEIHANEIVLLAYYVADVNIETVFNDLYGGDAYVPYDGLCLTDTFMLTDTRVRQGQSFRLPGLAEGLFDGNNELIRTQCRTPIEVIVGNPPYNDGKGRSYPELDRRLKETYVRNSNATLRNSVYDTYVKAFRWASDRLPKNGNGVVAFITNAGWLDGAAMDGMRTCLVREFSSIWVLNLRGNCLISGEKRKREGDNIFGEGSRASIAITILVRKSAQNGPATIHYHDIGDCLSREEKLDRLARAKDINGFPWTTLEPDEHGDWLNKRTASFRDFPVLGDKKEGTGIFGKHYSCGLLTGRGAWCFNFSRQRLAENIGTCIACYTACLGREPTRDARRIMWTDRLLGLHARGKHIGPFSDAALRPAMYRPFCREWYYEDNALTECRYKLPQIFPLPESRNLVICISSDNKASDFSCLITDHMMCCHFVCIGGSQCFPLYCYEEASGDLLRYMEKDAAGHVRKDTISEAFRKTVGEQYGQPVSKEDIFFYIYGILHSPDYRKTFAADLRKSLPRIPLVDSYEDFMAFVKAGRDLADIHLNYESRPPCADVHVGMDPGNEDFRVEKMNFPRKDDRSILQYNAHVRLEGIPERVYAYRVNERSPVEWIMERYQIRTDKKSGIVNDPNDWGREHGNPRYILDLLLSCITLSLETLDIVEKLPRLSLPGSREA